MSSSAMISDSFPSKENNLSRIESYDDETVPESMEQSTDDNSNEFTPSDNIESERDDSSQVESYCENDSDPIEHFANSVEKLIEMFPERITMDEMFVEEEQSKLDGTISEIQSSDNNCKLSNDAQESTDNKTSESNESTEESVTHKSSGELKILYYIVWKHSLTYFI